MKICIHFTDRLHIFFTYHKRYIMAWTIIPALQCRFFKNNNTTVIISTSTTIIRLSLYPVTGTTQNKSNHKQISWLMTKSLTSTHWFRTLWSDLFHPPISRPLHSLHQSGQAKLPNYWSSYEQKTGKNGKSSIKGTIVFLYSMCKTYFILFFTYHFLFAVYDNHFCSTLSAMQSASSPVHIHSRDGV